MRRSAEQLTHTSPTVATELARSRDALRRQLRDTFEPELEGRPVAEARLLLDALELSTSWETWEQLERLGRTAAVCRRTMEALTGAALSIAPMGRRP